jgi:prevent-host-death family protein
MVNGWIFDDGGTIGGGGGSDRTVDRRNASDLCLTSSLTSLGGTIMRAVSLVEFRKRADAVLRRVGQGESVLLTRRGRPAARLEPVTARDVGPEDPIYRLGELAAEGGEALSNREMDRLISGA